MNDQEKEISQFEAIKAESENSATVRDPANGWNGRRGRADREFPFRKVFGDSSGQEEIFEEVGRGAAESLLAGKSTTLFAYGATGAGKTHTMLGSPGQPGLVPRIVARLFEGESRVLEVTFVEVYNEGLVDLLTGGRGLEIREAGRRTTVIGATRIEAANAAEALAALRVGETNRTREATAANEFSSRSHALLTLSFRSDGVGEIGRGASLTLVDLAGSERAALTQNRGARLVEGANINKSLLALGNCINALADPKKPHVPFRDSKLTRMLKLALTGETECAMIANVSPAAVAFEDSLNTLKYALRASAIKLQLLARCSSLPPAMIPAPSMPPDRPPFAALLFELESRINDHFSEEKALSSALLASPESPDLAQRLALLRAKHPLIEAKIERIVPDNFYRRYFLALYRRHRTAIEANGLVEPRTPEASPAKPEATSPRLHLPTPAALKRTVQRLKRGDTLPVLEGPTHPGMSYKKNVFLKVYRQRQSFDPKESLRNSNLKNIASESETIRNESIVRPSYQGIPALRLLKEKYKLLR